MSNPLCYEIMTPESVGVPTSKLVLGKHSGRHALALRYQELGYSLAPDEVSAAYGRFSELADRKKRIYDQDLIALLSAAARTNEQSPSEAGAKVSRWSASSYA